MLRLEVADVGCCPGGGRMNEEQAREIAIAILDEFEELLAAKGIKVPGEDREGREEEACLYGTEYYALEDAVVGILMEGMDTEQGDRGTEDGPDEEAKAACEAMRRRMAETPEALAQRSMGKR